MTLIWTENTTGAIFAKPADLPAGTGLLIKPIADGVAAYVIAPDRKTSASLGVYGTVAEAKLGGERYVAKFVARYGGRYATAA